MDRISFLCFVFLVNLCQMQGSSAVTPVFVQKGKDVLLDVTKAHVLEDFLFLGWNFNKTVVLITFSPGREATVSAVYSGRIEFSVKNYSVKLMNLQEADSGVYTARVTGTQKEQITEYSVTVQDPVPPVELTVDSVSHSSDSCNLTVTCSTPDSHINSTFTCDPKSCSQEGGERSEVTTAGASLQVYLVNDLIICNHSNQVSLTKNMTDTQHFCPRHADLEISGNNVVVIVLVFFIIILIIVAAILIKSHRKRRKYKRKNIENTIYAVPQVEATAQRLDPTNDASDLSPTSTYSLVGPHTETQSNALPESLYAQVKMSDRS